MRLLVQSRNEKFDVNRYKKNNRNSTGTMIVPLKYLTYIFEKITLKWLVPHIFQLVKFATYSVQSMKKKKLIDEYFNLNSNIAIMCFMISFNIQVLILLY